MFNRRDILKAGAGSIAAACAAAAQQGPGPSDPSTAIDVNKTNELPAWAFRTRLPIPPVPRPTAIDTFENLNRPGAMPFGPNDTTPIGEVFHGVAREWGETPEHWRAFGLNPSLYANLPTVRERQIASWRDKQDNFGAFLAHDGSDALIGNWGGFPIKCYKVPILELRKSLTHHPIPARLHGYSGIIPGPMYAFRIGQPVVIRYENHLETETSVHLHGGHSPSHSDGFPLFHVLQGKARDYFYPNILPLRKPRESDPGNENEVSIGDAPCRAMLHPEKQMQAVRRTRTGYEPDLGEAQSSVWYHDHAHDAAGYNVSRGLAGVARYFGERELRLIREGVLPGLREASCVDPERDALVTDPVKVAELEDPENPGYYRFGKEPYHNPFDIYMAIQDLVVDQATGQLSYDSNGHNGYLGDMALVNGEAFPYIDVEDRKYRLRMLDGSNARIYRLRILSEADVFRVLRDGVEGTAANPLAPETLAAGSLGYEDIAAPFLQIGKDSWLWSSPLPRTSVTIAMANRADIVVDFGALAPDLAEGEERAFYLVNTMPQTDARGPSVPLADGGAPPVLPLPFDTVADPEGLVPTTTVAELPKPMLLVKFVVRRAPRDPSDPSRLVRPDATITVDSCINPHDAIRDDEVEVVREFTFQRAKGVWMINKRLYDPMIANATPTLGSAEEWVLRSGDGGWWHPIHIHLESHQLVSYEKDFTADAIVDPADPSSAVPTRNLVNVTAQIPDIEVRGLHDTQILVPHSVARIRMRFRTWNGPFVFHSCNAMNEDTLMHNFEPVPLTDPMTREGKFVAADTGKGSAANLVPETRTHGDNVTLQPSPGDDRRRKTGELPWNL